MIQASLRALVGSALALSCALGAIQTPLQAQDDAVRARSRVERILRKMIATKSVAVKQTTQRERPRNVRGNVARPAPQVLRYTRAGDYEVWQRSGMKIARRGARWSEHGANKSWSACKLPQSSAWLRLQLTDPEFLAERLLVHSKELPWKLEQTGELDSRPVRKYSCTIDGETAHALGRSGTVPYTANENPLAMLVLLAGGNNKIRAPKTPDVRYEVEILEDPKSKLPARIVVRMYSDGQAAGGGVAFAVQRVVVAGGNGGQPAEEEEDDEEDDEKEKPTVTVTLDFSSWGEGEALAEQIPEDARKALTPPQLEDPKAGEAGDGR